MSAMCQYLLITMQGAVNTEEFTQPVKKGILQVFRTQVPNKKQTDRGQYQHQ